MSHDCKPDGFPQTSPYLMASGGEAVLRFLQVSFDGVPLRRFEGPGGTIAHLESKIGDSVVMLSEGGEASPPFLPGSIFICPASTPAIAGCTRRAASRSGSRFSRMATPTCAVERGTPLAIPGGSRPRWADLQLPLPGL